MSEAPQEPLSPKSSVPVLPAEQPLQAIPAAGRRTVFLRMGLLVLISILLICVGHAMGAEQYLNRETLRRTLTQAGIWGFVLFTLAFALGELLHIPGVVFMAAAVYAYGKITGGLLSIFAALIAISICFWFIRLIGGRPLQSSRWELAQRILGHLDRRPILSITMLRTCFMLAPFINYVLALSGVRFRDFFIGSAIGLIPSMTTVILFLSWFLN